MASGVTNRIERSMKNSSRNRSCSPFISCGRTKMNSFRRSVAAMIVLMKHRNAVHQPARGMRAEIAVNVSAGVGPSGSDPIDRL